MKKSHANCVGQAVSLTTTLIPQKFLHQLPVFAKATVKKTYGVWRGYILASGVSLLAISWLVTSATALQAAEVNVYTYRSPDLIKPLFEAFAAETGIKVNAIFANDGLIERMKAEGASSPADVLITTDVARLTLAQTSGITHAVKSKVLEESIPASYRDIDNHWFGLSLRSRVLYASRERVKEDALTYEDLADKKWKGRICTRSGQHAYNMGLFAAAVTHWGEAKTEEWLKGVKANLAFKPSGGDRDQARAIFDGKCDVALGNSYYYALMQTNEKEPEQKKWAESVKIIQPTFKEAGTHVNISGIAMARHAPHPQQAVALMEFLASDKAQQIYAAVNHEYPVKPGVTLSPLVAGIGALKPDRVLLNDIAKNRTTSSLLVDKVGFDR